MEVTRRQFLKGAAAVPAVALIPNVILRRVPKYELTGDISGPGFLNHGTKTKTWVAVSGYTQAIEFEQTPTGLEPHMIEWTDDYTGPDDFVFTPNGGDVTVYWNDDGRYAF